MTQFPNKAVSRRAAMLRVGTLLASVLLPTSGVAEAEATSPRIGVLIPLGLDSVVTQLLRKALVDLGYVEGTTVLIDWRSFRDSGDQLRSAATALVSAQVDLIVAIGTNTARAAMAATTTIPIVFLSGDPVAGNLADSLSHPGRNATGVSILSPELTAKRLEYLHVVAPRVRRVTYLMNSMSVLEAKQYKELARAARVLRLKVRAVDCRSAEELEPILSALQREPPDGLVISGNPLFLDLGAKIASAVSAMRRPAVFPYREYHPYGVLMSYGPGAKDNMYRVAGYVNRILKGAKPAELPIEQSTKMDLVIDMRVARAMEIRVPDSLLTLADEVLR